MENKIKELEAELDLEIDNRLHLYKLLQKKDKAIDKAIKFITGPMSHVSSNCIAHRKYLVEILKEGKGNE